MDKSSNKITHNEFIFSAVSHCAIGACFFSLCHSVFSEVNVFTCPQVGRTFTFDSFMIFTGIHDLTSIGTLMKSKQKSRREPSMTHHDSMMKRNNSEACTSLHRISFLSSSSPMGPHLHCSFHLT